MNETPTIYLSRRNLLALLSKLDRDSKGEETTRTIVIYKQQSDEYQQTMDAVFIIAVQDEDYYGKQKRTPGDVYPSDLNNELHCPNCGRLKATSADDCAAGLCPTWYAVRDKEAKEDCNKYAKLKPRSIIDETKPCRNQLANDGLPFGKSTCGKCGSVLSGTCPDNVVVFFEKQQHVLQNIQDS